MNENNEQIKDKIRGSLIAGAAGDALGYAVEFLNLDQIKAKFGNQGIQNYELKNGLALISDDTQMTLFTAIGLIDARNSNKESYAQFVNQAYLQWYELQNGTPLRSHHSWLTKVPAMSANRAPGRTCLSALADGGNGTIEKPINDSKGCGGIMRVAPVGLFFQNNRDVEKINILAAHCAALTHGHELGYMPSAALAQIINSIVYSNMNIQQATDDCLKTLPKIFPNKAYLGDLLTIINHAILCSKNNKSDQENIRAIGEGWVAEETLAIALYCALRYPNDISSALRASVNHDGDSDSTGSVCGNIVGAIVGYEKIPQQWKTNLECHDVILRVADELFGDKVNQNDNKSLQEVDEKSLYDQYEKLLIERDEKKKEADLLQSWYIRTFGNLVCRIFRQQINCVMLKHAIEYYQKKRNRGEEIDVNEFEQYILEITKEYKQKLQEMVDDYEREKNNIVATLTEDEMKQVKQIYRRIALKIHPDMRPELEANPQVSDLWHRTVIAYNCNKLEELQEIEFQVNKLLKSLDMDADEVEIPNISAQILRLQNEINRIINNDPYLYKTKFDTDQKVNKHWNDLKSQLEKLVNYQHDLETHFASLSNDLNFRPWQMN